MPVDKLEFLTYVVTEAVERVVRDIGKRTERYELFADLSKSELRLPVLIFLFGRRGERPVHKIIVLRASKRTYRRVVSILTAICGDPNLAWLFRLDVALDLVGFSAVELSQHCLVVRTQKTELHRSAGGFTSYPCAGKQRRIMLYDKFFVGGGRGARIETQLRGAALPFRKFSDLSKYSGYDFLRGVKFLQFRPMRHDLTPLQRLAAVGMQFAVRYLGLQNAKNLVPASSWTYLRRKFFRFDRRFRGIRRLMRNEMRSWLDGRSPSREK